MKNLDSGVDIYTSLRIIVSETSRKMINDTIDEALPKVVKQLSETLQKSQ